MKRISKSGPVGLASSEHIWLMAAGHDVSAFLRKLSVRLLLATTLVSSALAAERSPPRIVSIATSTRRPPER